MALAVAALLAPVVALRPADAGYGTARQWGLPSCSYLVRTGRPCPACGMTTAVSATVRGRWALAARAHLGGALLTAAALLWGGAGVWQALTGRRILAKLHWGRWWLAGAGLAIGLGWAINLAAGLGV